MKTKAHGLYIAVFSAFIAVSAQASPESDALQQAREFQQNGDWDRAISAAQGVGHDVIKWHWLRSGRGEFADFRQFLLKNADWPGLPLLAQKGESVIAPDANPQHVVDYLTAYPPRTGAGALRLVEAYARLDLQADAQASAVVAWTQLSMKEVEESALLSALPDVLAPYHVERARQLLWNQDFSGATRLLAHLPAGWDKIIDAVRRLDKDEDGVDGAVAAVPNALAGEAVLARARFEWRVRHGHNDGALTLLLQRSAGREALGRPENWGDRRRTLSRQLMRDGKVSLAYAAAARHGLLPEEKHYSDLEWLAGYISLRYLNEPVKALDHFNRFRLSVKTPISLGRAGYWEGRALEGMGAKSDAAAAYAYGAQFQTSYYGLLSAQRIGMPLDPNLAGEPRYPDYTKAAFMGSSVLQAALVLHDAGQLPLAARFMRHLGESLSREELGQLGDLALDRDPYLAVLVAKFAADQGVVLNRAYYPLHPLSETDLPVPKELALAISRRESEFYAVAESRVGARGLMQLMPKTGQAMADKIGLTDYTNDSLLDPVINGRLGSQYLAQLIDQFGANMPLVAAGYNAGPTRARRWIDRYGDPRTAQTDAIDWIEHIPFRETRNYVMRVTESLPAYRARLAGTSGANTLLRDISGR